MFALRLMIALYFYSNLWIYALIHNFKSNDNIWQQHSFIKYSILVQDEFF